jgi:hypothetical protein
MSFLNIDLDEKTVALLDEAAHKEGVSRSIWVRRAIESRLNNPLPESFFEVLGTWEDHRSPQEIIDEIRNLQNDTLRASLD